MNEEPKYYCTNCGQIIENPHKCPYCGAGPELIVPYENED